MHVDKGDVNIHKSDMSIRSTKQKKRRVSWRYEPFAIGSHLSCSFTSSSYGSPCVSWASLSIGGSDSSGDCTPDSSLSFFEGDAAMLYYFRAAAAVQSFLRRLLGRTGEDVSLVMTPLDAVARTRQTFLPNPLISALSAAAGRHSVGTCSTYVPTVLRCDRSTRSRPAGVALARWTLAVSAYKERNCLTIK